MSIIQRCPLYANIRSIQNVMEQDLQEGSLLYMAIIHRFRENANIR